MTLQTSGPISFGDIQEEMGIPEPPTRLYDMALYAGLITADPPGTKTPVSISAFYGWTAPQPPQVAVIGLHLDANQTGVDPAHGRALWTNASGAGSGWQIVVEWYKDGVLEDTSTISGSNTSNTSPDIYSYGDSWGVSVYYKNDIGNGPVSFVEGTFTGGIQA